MTTSTLGASQQETTISESQIHDLYTSFNKGILKFIMTLAHSEGELSEDTKENLAKATGRTSHFIQKLFVAAIALNHMPHLSELLHSSGEFDLDRLATLGRQVELFERIDYPELQEALIQLLEKEGSSPTANKLGRTIREAEYSISKRLIAEPKPRNNEPKNKETPKDLKEGISIREFGELSEIHIVCKSSEARSIHRFLKQSASSLGGTEVEALRKLVRGEKPPRIQLLGVQLPSGKAFVEDIGWMSADELKKSQHLQTKEILDEESIASILFHVLDLTTP